MIADDIKALREALEAGPTAGVWHWDSDEVKGDPMGRRRYQVTTVGKTITKIYYSSYEGGPTNAAADAAYIAACHPGRIARLLEHVEALEAWCDKAFEAHPNIDIDIDALAQTGEKP